MGVDKLTDDDDDDESCFTSGVLPAVWKSANITPVFKKGTSSNVSNYRPISLTSVFCKLFERIVN